LDEFSVSEKDYGSGIVKENARQRGYGKVWDTVLNDYWKHEIDYK
jgi:hypothetical protein